MRRDADPVESGGGRPHLRRPRCHGRRPGRMTVLPGGGEAAGEGLRSGSKPPLLGASRRVHERRPSRACWPQAGRRACLRRRGRTWTREWRLPSGCLRTGCPPAARSTLVEFLVTRRGVRQQREMMARARADSKGENPWRKSRPSARAPGRGLLRHFRRRIRNIGRAGQRAARFTRRTPRGNAQTGASLVTRRAARTPMGRTTRPRRHHRR